MELLGCLRKAAWRGEARLKTYVWRVAGHTCLDAIRRARRRPIHEEVDDEAPVPSADPSPLDRVIALDRAGVLLAALDAVPADCRELWQGILAGLSYRDLSERMSISEGTLRVRAHRCRKRTVEILNGNAATRRVAQA